MPRFDLSIAREVLSAALSRASVCAASKSTLPIATCVKLEGTSNGALRLTTTNFDRTLTIAVAADIPAGVAICLPAKRLLDVVNCLPPGVVHIRGNENGTKAVVSSGKSRLELNGFPADEFPAVQRSKFDDEITLDAKFVSNFSTIAAHSSAADSRPVLGGVLLDSRPDGLWMTALDGNAGAQLLLGPAIETKGSWNFPSDLAPVLAKLFGSAESVKVSVSSVTVRLTTDGVRLETRLIEGQYPDYPRIFDRKDAKATGSVDAALLSASVARVRLLGDAAPVVMTWEPGRLIVRGESAEGRVDDEIPAKYLGTDGSTQMVLDPEYLKNAITTVGAESLRFDFVGGNRPIVISNDTDQAQSREAAIAQRRLPRGMEPAAIAA